MPASQRDLSPRLLRLARTVQPVPALAAAAVLVLAAGGIATVGGGDPPRPDPKSPDQVERVAVPPRVVDRFGDPLPDGAVLRLGTTRLRHADVCALAFTADKTLISFGRDYVLRTWDPATGRQLAERTFEKDRLYRQRAGYLSPDGRRLAFQLDDRMKVFDASSGRELSTATLTDNFEAIARFSPDGSRLAMVDQQGKLQLCDVGANTCRGLADLGNSHTSDLAFSRDGKRLAAANYQHGAIVWDLANGRELVRYKFDDRDPASVDFDATGDVLAVLQRMPVQSVQFVRVSTGVPAEGWGGRQSGGFAWARFGPDGSTIFLGGREGMWRFDPKATQEGRAAYEPAAVPPVFSADRKLVASGGRHVIRVWEAESVRPLVPVSLDDPPSDEVHGVAVSPDGKWIVTKGSDYTLVRVWGADGKVKVTLRSGTRYPMFSPDGKHLYGLAGGGIGRWDLPGWKESACYTFALPADQVHIFSFALSGDGRRLAALTQATNRRVLPPGEQGDVATVTVWDTATAKRVVSREVGSRPLGGHGAFGPDLQWYFCGAYSVSLTGGADYQFDVPEKWQFSQLAVSPDGRLVAQTAYEPRTDGAYRRADSKGIVIHEATTGKRVLTLPLEPCGPIAFTPDSRGLVVTEPDAITRWDLLTQKPVVRHKAPGRFIGYYGNSFASSLAIAPDGSRAITGHVDSTALVWDIRAPGRERKKLSDRELATAWDDLAENDAAKAYAVIWSLADAPAEAVPFLRARLRPAVEPTTDKVGKLIGRLDAAAFADREAAEKELRDLGDTVVPALRARLKSGVSAEQKERIDKILAAATVPTLPPGERLRQVRAIVALEQAGTPEARQVLGELARGAPDDRFTKEAASARERMR